MTNFLCSHSYCDGFRTPGRSLNAQHAHRPVGCRSKAANEQNRVWGTAVRGHYGDLANANRAAQPREGGTGADGWGEMRREETLRRQFSVGGRVIACERSYGKRPCAIVGGRDQQQRVARGWRDCVRHEELMVSIDAGEEGR